MWSQLKEMCTMVFGVSSQRTNKWFYISAFNHERAGAIFTREQRTSLLLTCFTLFRWFSVSTSRNVSQRCSHILIQKSSWELDRLWGRWKVQVVWPVTISRCLNNKKKDLVFASPFAECQMSLVLLPFARVRAVFSLFRDRWEKEQRKRQLSVGWEGRKKKRK